jgi:flagellar hook-associated protein 1
MGTLSASLFGAASALDAFQYAVGVSQNNVDNASTPGYASQGAVLEADPFDPETGLAGGVSTGTPINSRDLLAESAVWQQSAAQGAANAQNEALSDVQNALPVSDGSGIPAAMTNFFSAASAWSASPDDESDQQAVIDSANSLAQTFNTTAAGVASASQSVDQSITSTVAQVNQLTTQLSQLNAAEQDGGQNDSGLQAQIYSNLETLSGLVNISVLPQQDGTVNVTLAGGAALVVGSQQYALTVGSAAASTTQPIDPQAPPHTIIEASDGSDITSQITSGTLGGLLQVRDVTIPSLIGDASQPGALNQLASAMATTVNQIITQGFVSPGTPATSGLFTTDPANPTAAAATLAVDPNMTASGLPAIDQNNVPNGVPLALAALANPQTSADEIDSVSYTAFYGNTAAEVGSQLDQAQSNQSLSAQSLSQAQNLRQTVQGVSLDAEAINILQFQDGYQAVAKVVTTIDNMMQSVINMLPTES